MSDAFLTLLGINLVGAAAVALVMALRLPARRLFGPRVAYGLWSLVPLVCLALLVPARVVTVAIPAAPKPSPDMIFGAGVQAASVPAAPGLWPFAVALWIAGGLVSLAYLVWRQVEFGRAARHGLAGPAVIGLLRPRIVTPFDFGRRYTPREQLVVLAHEQTHIARRDTLVNAAVALARCVNWFNPAVHLVAHYLRIDQEFACDAQVVAAHPTARRSYAEAMLKTQLAARPLPIGCYWPAQSAHPLAERIRLLSRRNPGRGRRGVGTAAVALLALTAAWSTWAARPAQVVQIPMAAPARTSPVQATTVVVPGPPAKAAHPEKTTAEPPPILVQAAAAQGGAEEQGPPPEPEAAPTPSPPLPVRVRKVHAVARQSAVAPGSAVRVLATMIDPDGVPLTTDLTAFGSQSAYRSGSIQRNGSRYALFTSVFQEGERLWVTASLTRSFTPSTSGTIILGSGETGKILLGNGQMVTVTPTARRETAEEVEEGRRALREMYPISDKPLRTRPWRPNGGPLPRPGPELPI